MPRPNRSLIQRGNRRAQRKERFVDALCSRTDTIRSGCIACVHGAELVLASRVGKATCTVGTVHGSLSRSHRDRAARFIPYRVCFRFRLRDFADHRVRDQVGCSLLLRKHLRAWAFVHYFAFLGKEPGPEHGELIVLYLAALLTLLIAGPGSASLDRLLARKP